MKARIAGLTSAVLGLAIGLVATAQETSTKAPQGNPKTDQHNRGKETGRHETIRGIISGITIEGEMAVDQRTHRAASAEATFLTVVGSPMDEMKARASEAKGEHQDKERGDRMAWRGWRRHNVYILSVSPKTKVYLAKEHGQPTASEKSASEVAFDELEIGDHVTASFLYRDDIQSGQGNKHGRHRTYFGDASSITILSEPRDRRSEATGKEHGSSSDRGSAPK